MKTEKVGIGISLLIVLVVTVILFSSIHRDLNQAGEESLHHITEAVKRAAVQCYALEGSYPPDLEYLEEHYGLVLNRDAYFYHYEIIGSNIMPQIGVYRRWN